MASARETTASGPDIWSTIGGWLALVLGMVTVNLWAWTQNYGDVWVIRGAIVTLACLIWWLFGYGGRLLDVLRGWTRSGGLNVAVVTLGIIAAAVGVNYLLHRYHWQRDLTKNQRFTLSDRSAQVLRGMKQPINATVFVLGSGRNRQTAENLMRQYRDVTDRFKYKLVDPLERPDLFREMGMQTDEGAVLEYGGKKQQVATFGEKEMTTALLKLSRDRQPKVYFLQGHGEMAYESTAGMADPQRSLSVAAEMLTNAQWQLEKLFLIGPGAKVPDPADAAVIVIAGPQKPLTADEEKQLKAYLEKGGRILALLSPGGPDLKGILEPYGMTAQSDYLYGRFQGGLIIIQRPEEHAATRRISTMAFLQARGIRPADTPPTGITSQPLLKSGDGVVASPKPLQKLDANAKTGDFTLAAVGTKAAAGTTPESRVVGLGSTLSFSDAYLNSSLGGQLYNRDFFANLVNWLGDQQDLVSIEPKSTQPEALPVTPQHSALLALIFWVEFPLLAVALGIYIYLKRR